MQSVTRKLIQWMDKNPFLFFLSVFALFSFSIAGLEITRIDVRFALMLEDLINHPVGVFPTINGVEYPDYFSTYFLCSWLTTLGGRWVNLWSLVLPSLLLGAWTVFMTWKTGSLFSKETGFYAALFSFLSLEYLSVFLSFGIDVPVAAAGITILYLLEKSKEHLARRTMFAFGLLLFFSFAMRGGLGLVVFGAAAGGWLLARREWKHVVMFGLTGAAVSVFCVGTLYALVHLQGGDALWKSFLNWHITSRMGDSELLYYFTSGLLSYAPGVLLFLLVICFFHKRLFLSPETAGLMGYIILPMLLLSIPECKHLRYITLCVPAVWIVAAWGMCRLPENIWTVHLTKGLELLNRYLPILMILLWCGGFALVIPKNFHAVPPWFNWSVGVILTVLLFRLLDRKEFILRPAMALGLYFLFAIYPFIVLSEESKSFVDKTMASGPYEKIYFFMIPVDHDDLKFIRNLPLDRRRDLIYLRNNPLKEFCLKNSLSYSAAEQTLKDLEKDKLVKILKKQLPAGHLYRKMYVSKEHQKAFSDITEKDLIILRTRKNEQKMFREYTEKYAWNVHTIHKGQMGHRDFLAVRLESKKVKK